MLNSAGRDCTSRELPRRRSGRRVFSRMFSPLWVAYIGRFGRRPNSSFSGRMFDRSTPALLSRNEFKISSRRGRFCMPLSAKPLLLFFFVIELVQFPLIFFFFFLFWTRLNTMNWKRTWNYYSEDINSVEELATPWLNICVITRSLSTRFFQSKYLSRELLKLRLLGKRVIGKLVRNTNLNRSND